MIPFFQIITIHLGPIPIQAWGLMVALGILAGVWVSAKMAQRRGLNPKVIWDMAAWIIIGAFVGARVFMLVYTPETYLSDPLEMLRLWHGGFSIIGGFIGAFVSGFWFLRAHKLDILAYSDSAIFGLPLGLFIGRIGCFLIHDHPGKLTDFALGVNYPDGTRHDLGLYDSILGLVLFLLFLFFAKRNAKTGSYSVAFLILYGASRFFLDFLRATNGAIVDTRYFNLTPAQYAAVVMVGIGVWIAFRISPSFPRRG